MTSTLATFRCAILDAWANRASFLLQIVFMVVNDLTWIVFWGLFFHKSGVLRGWTLHDILIMFSVLTFSSGLCFGLVPNCRHIARLVTSGQLDETLVLPVRALAHILASRVEATNAGDMVFGVVLFAVAGDPTPLRCLIYAVVCLAAGAVLVSFMVTTGSLALFSGGQGDVSDFAVGAITIAASYPLDFFGGPVRIVLFSIIPAAFVTGLPTNLLLSFSWSEAAALIAVAVGMTGLAVVTFSSGLRRYTSGSLWAL